MQKRISVNDIGYLFCKCIGLFYGSRFAPDFITFLRYLMAQKSDEVRRKKIQCNVGWLALHLYANIMEKNYGKRYLPIIPFILYDATNSNWI